jgi:hypothetical protein
MKADLTGSEGSVGVQIVKERHSYTVSYRGSGRMVERGSASIFQTHNLKVVGSNPTPATKAKGPHFGGLDALETSDR